MRRPEQDLEEVADIPPLSERMTQGEVRHDLVVVPSSLSLTQHVAALDQLREDPVSGAFRDPDRCGDVAQPDSRVVGHAREHVCVVGQKVPPRIRLVASPASYIRKSIS